METIDRANRKLPRICAYLIDAIIIILLISLITEIRFLNPSYDKLLKSTERYSQYYKDYTNGKITTLEYNENIEKITFDIYKSGTSNYIVSFVVIIGYLGIFQKYNKGQTIGKKLMKLKVASIDDNEIPLVNFLLRIIPMYIYGLGGIFTLIACSCLPYLLSVNDLSVYISSISICNLLLFLIDIEFFLIRKDRRSLHDLLSKTKIVESK